MRPPLVLLFVTLFTTAATAQDVEFIRAIDRIQQQRPATIGTTSRIAPETEPGTPLVIHGRLYKEDGTTPLAGAIIFAYHTDRTGVYDRPGAPPHSWRLRGWARTDSAGRFEFRTIRPGAYPGGNNPAHVHFTVFTDTERYPAGELRFEDDKLNRPDQRAESSRRGAFGSIQPVTREGTTEHVNFNVRLDSRQRF